jgi:hypothetical protein
VDNQAFGSDKEILLAKESDVISLDDLLVDKLGAGVARNYLFGVANCKQVRNDVKGNYLLVSFCCSLFSPLLLHVFSFFL